MAGLEVFSEGEWSVRSVLVDGEPWFVAADVARALGYRDAATAVRMLDADERGTHSARTTKCLVCDVPTVLLAVTGCSSVYDDTCPHRATTTTTTNNNGPAPQAEPCGPALTPEERTLNG